MAKRANAKDIVQLKKEFKELKKEIKEFENSHKLVKKRTSIKNGTKVKSLKKASVTPNYTSKTILTDSTWNYVEIFLKQEKEEEALFYWEQAKNFSLATANISNVSAPLTIYYCFLNAVKTLLTYKKVPFNLKHGVSGKLEDGRVNLQNEKISIKPQGVLSGLCNYFGERIYPTETYSMKDILFNLPYIHRAFQLTYSDSGYPELFIPIYNPRFVHDKIRKKGWFECNLEPKHSNNTFLNKLLGFSVDRYYPNIHEYVIRRNKTFEWDCTRNIPSDRSLRSFKNYYKNIRRQTTYIFSPGDLWYLKRKDLRNSHLIDKLHWCCLMLLCID